MTRDVETDDRSTGQEAPSLPAAGLEHDQAGQILQRVAWPEAVQGVIFSWEARIVSQWGDLPEEEWGQIARQVDKSWQKTAGDINVAQIQFLNSRHHDQSLLLYTRAVVIAPATYYLITLISLLQITITELRRPADDAAGQLAALVSADQGIVLGADAVPAGAASPAERSPATYAIVWRSVEPMPAAIHSPLRRAFEQLAQENGCLIKYLAIEADMVHLVVACPPGRNSIWAVHLFKRGAEEKISQQSGLSARLWAKGHYAVESEQPLAEAELNLFKESNE